MRQSGDDAEELRGGPQDCGFAGFLIRRSSQGPRLFGGQIFIRAAMTLQIVSRARANSNFS